MKPTKFRHSNVEFAKDQDEYNTLPALRIDSPQGEIVSCWKLSFKERFKLLFTGRVWLSLMSFNKPLTPSYMSVNRSDCYYHPDDEHTFLKKLKNRIKNLFNKSA